MFSMQQRLPALRVPPIGFAHRGAKAHARENTLEAFQLAIRLGATGLEADVWITRDGVAVLDHDGKIKHGILGFGPFKTAIQDIDSTDLPEHIPTLEELYESCGTDYELSLDVKSADAFEQTISVARTAGAEPRLWLCHHDWTVVASWRQSTSARLVDSTRLARMKDGPERRAAALAEAGIDGVNMHYKDWSGGLTTLFHRFGRYCLGWDAQHTRVLEDLVRMGLDGVYSDHVDKMMAALRGEQAPAAEM